MRPYLKYAIAALCVIVIAFSSCKKDEEETKTNKELVMAHPWKIISYLIDPPYDWGVDVPVSDIWALTEPCDQDDLWIFKADNVLVYDEGPTKCHQDDPQIQETTWSLFPGEQKLVINGQLFDIQALEEHKMILASTTSQDSITYNLTMTFVKN